MNRRGFMGSILALGAAPAIVRADSLMRIVAPMSDMEYLQSIINDANARGVAAYFPPGRYKISGAGLVVPCGSRIYGGGTVLDGHMDAPAMTIAHGGGSYIENITIEHSTPAIYFRGVIA